jgi:RNA polymerase sigma factor (sigma-70 family)
VPAFAATHSSVGSLLRDCLPQVRSTFRRFRIPPGDRDDLVQEAALALLRNYDSIENPGAWFVGCLKHKCLHYWRSRRRRLYESIDSGLLEAVAPHSPDSPERDLVRMELRAALGRIDKRCRIMLEMRYLMDCPTTELASAAGCRPTSVGKLTSRCLGALSKALNGDRRSA